MTLCWRGRGNPIGENGLLKQLTKVLVELGPQAERAEHLGLGKHESVANPAGITRKL